jgi:hypothetical protein
MIPVSKVFNTASRFMCANINKVPSVSSTATAVSKPSAPNFRDDAQAGNASGWDVGCDSEEGFMVILFHFPWKIESGPERIDSKTFDSKTIIRNASRKPSLGITPMLLRHREWVFSIPPFGTIFR